jgi:molybdopterin-guanine dinucleotide biosynthesis protein A
VNPTFVVLTGGKSTRFGSDKSTIEIDGEPLVIRILRTLPAGEVVVVGPEFVQNLRKITFVQESPLGGGPVAAMAAALQLISAPEVFIIATDMPYASEIVKLLLARPLDGDALVPIDAEGERQPLCARYQSSVLRQAIDNLGDPTGKSMRSVMAELDIEELLVEGSMLSKLIDIDTQADYVNVLNNMRTEMEKK